MMWAGDILSTGPFPLHLTDGLPSELPGVRLAKGWRLVNRPQQHLLSGSWGPPGSGALRVLFFWPVPCDLGVSAALGMQLGGRGLVWHG